MKGLLLLFGESFRTGGQGTRIRGSKDSYTGQLNAAESHMKFISYLKSKQCHADVYLSTYTTQFDTDLTAAYGSHILKSDYYPTLIGPNALLHNALQAMSTLDQYDWVLCMRIDLYLKDHFMDVFDPSWNTIRFPSICFKPHHRCGVHPRVNDMMIHVPKKYFRYIRHVRYDISAHNQWARFITNTDLHYRDLDTMLNTYHDSYSAKDLNPIYFIVNRPESTVTHSGTDTFDKWAP